MNINFIEDVINLNIKILLQQNENYNSVKKKTK